MQAARQSWQIPQIDKVDGRVILHDISWSEYELLLAIRGDSAGVRITYLNGELELSSPSDHHEAIKKTIARLVEAYAEESRLDLNGYGSWTLRKPLEARGAEPDECYSLGPRGPVPDLAIEVVWTAGGIDELQVYSGLGVPEVWIWREGQIAVYRLRDRDYEPVERSVLLPGLDLSLLSGHIDPDDQTAAVRRFRAALR